MKELRKALAVGADEVVLLVEDRPFRDPAATAEVLASALEELALDAVFCGWKGIDNDSATVGGYLAERLGFSYASFVVKLEAQGGGLVAHREVEGATEVHNVELPCVITVQKGLAEPRFASLKGIMKAKRKPMTENPPAAAENASSIVAVRPPPDRAPGRIVGEGVDAVPELVRIFREDIHVL